MIRITLQITATPQAEKIEGGFELPKDRSQMNAREWELCHKLLERLKPLIKEVANEEGGGDFAQIDYDHKTPPNSR